MDQPGQPTQPAQPLQPAQPSHAASPIGRNEALADIDIDFTTDLMESMFETLPWRQGEPPERRTRRRNAVVRAIAQLKAENPLELMFAAHAIAAHHATMECFRLGMLTTDRNPDVSSRMHRNAIALSRMMHDTVDDLKKRQTPQQARIERTVGGKTP